MPIPGEDHEVALISFAIQVPAAALVDEAMRVLKRTFRPGRAHHSVGGIDHGERDLSDL
jgi:hypothetical protein